MTYRHDTQVGGNHYDQGDLPQHWDLAIMYRWDFFQYQITKYVMRWKDKHHTPEKKLEDLKKARSFLDKYIAHYESFLPPTSLSVEEKVDPTRQQSNAYWTNEGYYGDGKALFKCRSCGATTCEAVTPPLPHCPPAQTALDAK